MPTLGIQGLPERNRTKAVEAQYGTAHLQDISSTLSSNSFQSVIKPSGRQQVRIVLPITERTVSDSDRPSIPLIYEAYKKDNIFIAELMPGEPFVNFSACIQIVLQRRWNL